MDRETARRQMKAGLVAGGIAAGIFALSFVAFWVLVMWAFYRKRIFIKV